MPALDPATLVAWDRPGPRYTSYPPVPRWLAQLRPEVAQSALRRVRTPAQVYVHLPFCIEQCSYCGCNMVVARRHEVGQRYLDALRLAAARLELPAERIDVARIHLGGGTPTWLHPEELAQLDEILRTRFAPIEGAEISIEAHPAVTTAEHIATLDRLGFNRLSMGVQSLDPKVLAAVNRPSAEREVTELLTDAHARGWSVGLDLMYGLPAQTPDGLRDTLARIVALRPDRLSVFGYAHVPWMKRHQARLQESLLPTTEQRAELLLLSQQVLMDAGYEPVGFDHFALPRDELSVARREGRLHRNFMGYTTMPDVDMIGLGMSAISEVAGVYWQDDPGLGSWLRSVESGRPTTGRGWVLTAEDQLRRTVINELLCNLRLDLPEVEGRFGIAFADHFRSELAALTELVEAGFVTISADAIAITERGRLLVRLAAMAFDDALRTGQPQKARYSRAV